MTMPEGFLLDEPTRVRVRTALISDLVARGAVVAVLTRDDDEVSKAIKDAYAEVAAHPEFDPVNMLTEADLEYCVWRATEIAEGITVRTEAQIQFNWF